MFKPESRLIYSFLNRGRRDSVQAVQTGFHTQLCFISTFILLLSRSMAAPIKVLGGVSTSLHFSVLCLFSGKTLSVAGISSFLPSNSAMTGLHGLFMNVRRQPTARFLFLFFFFAKSHVRSSAAATNTEQNTTA